MKTQQIIWGLLFFAFFCFLPSNLLGQEIMQRMVSGRMGSKVAVISAGLSGILPSSVQGQSTSLSITKPSLSGIIPILSSPSDELGFGFSLVQEIIDTEAILPSTATPFPKDFSTINVGPYYKHRFNNRWLYALNLQVGSSSNDPFARLDVMNIGGNFILSAPSTGRNSWLFFLNYSSNRDFLKNFPIPGFGYSFDANWGRGMVGIPVLSMQIFHKKPVNFVVRYFPIITTYGEVGYDLSQKFRLALLFAWDDDHFWREDRDVKSYQTYIVEKDLGGYFLFRPERFLEIKIGGGLNFDRYIFEGKSVVRNRDYNRINLNNSQYLSLNISASFGGNKW